MLKIFIPKISIAEKVLRSIVVYLFLLLAFRFTGKRQVGQLTPFDLVVLLIISNVVQNAVVGNDNSLGGGLLGAVTILALNYAVAEVAYRSKRARRLLEAQPTLLIHNGCILHENLRRERVTLDELLAALRRNGVVEPTEVRFAVSEENGGISVVPRVTEGDAARLEKEGGTSARRAVRVECGFQQKLPQARISSCNRHLSSRAGVAKKRLTRWATVYGMDLWRGTTFVRVAAIE